MSNENPQGIQGTSTAFLTGMSAEKPMESDLKPTYNVGGTLAPTDVLETKAKASSPEARLTALEQEFGLLVAILKNYCSVEDRSLDRLDRDLDDLLGKHVQRMNDVRMSK